jgi:hypothetical protein
MRVIGAKRTPPVVLLALLAVISVTACSRPAVQPPGVAAAASGPAATPSLSPAKTLSPSPSPSPTPTPLPSISVPSELQGTWHAVVTGTTATSGTWTLRGTATDLLLKNPGASDTDYFSVEPIAITPTTLTLGADSGCPDQASVTEGSYTWSLTGGKLVIKLMSDSCGDRAATLTKTPWSKAP